MRRVILIILLLLTNAVCVTAQAPGRDIYNPQLQIIGARAMSLGGTNPLLKGDLNTILINPAVLGFQETNPFTISHHKIMGQFENLLISYSMPFEIHLPVNEAGIDQKINFGFTYGANVLHEIPETIQQLDDHIWPIDYYSAGFDLVAFTAGTELFNVFGFDTFSLGGGLKLMRQFVGNEGRAGLGLDAGAIFTYYIDDYFIDGAHIGISAINLIATPMSWGNLDGEAFMPVQVFMGAGVDMFDETLSLFAHNDITGLALGAEYALYDSFYIRGSTNFKRFSMGVGLVFEKVAGFFNQDYSLRMDYNYTQYEYPINDDPTNTFSITVLGEARSKTPKILSPGDDMATRETVLNLRGVGPKNTTIQIYNNDELVRTVISDKYGNWYFKNFPLKEGANVLTAKAYAIERGLSLASRPLVVKSDTLGPLMLTNAYPVEEGLRIGVTTNEKVTQMQGKFDNEFLEFTQITPESWIATIPMPEDLQNFAPASDLMHNLVMQAMDEIGNISPPQYSEFYLQVQTPEDRFVHYMDEVRVIGKSSAMVKDLKLNDSSVYVAQDMSFTVVEKLKPGKNLLTFKVTPYNDQELTYTMRVLRLITFPDLTRDIRERREIEFLATLGVLFPEDDGYFYPEKDVTRMFITKMMVKINNLKMSQVRYDLFFDVAKDYPGAEYIQAAIENGLIFAYPDGTFRPDQPLTISEALFLLSNAGIIEETEAGITETEYVKRRELAQIIAYLPRYELRIERLIDWDKGYFQERF
ncbi:S-layer homology domain-containing protein [Thermoproteota archaeon]